MTVKKLFLLAAIAFFGVVLPQEGLAANGSTLTRDATVPTTQSTVDMDSEEETDEISAGLLAPNLDMSNPAHRKKLLANFESERKILKKKGLSEDDLKGLKDAIINGDIEEIKRVYRMENGGKQ